MGLQPTTLPANGYIVVKIEFSEKLKRRAMLHRKISLKTAEKDCAISY